MIQSITLPMTPEVRLNLKAGDLVKLSGVLYTARDAAHKRLIELLKKGMELPMPIRDQVIYYVGPSPAPAGRIIGSAGPTSSYRMDSYAPALLDLGLSGMIGKGLRSPEVVEAMKRNGAVYFGAVGGAAALIAQTITQAQVIAFEDLGTEAVRRLTVRDFPAVVLIDTRGNSLYETGPAQYGAHA